MIEERNSLVYDRFIMPVGLHYYGITDDLKRRSKSYKSTTLQQYIDEYGWDNINTTIVAEGLTRKEAELLEDQLIRKGWKKGYCINLRGSGGEFRDNPSEYEKQRYANPECKIYYRVKNYNRFHTLIETPKEARQKYIETGYIPSYIKNDDII